jgi:hypothetical protein
MHGLTSEEREALWTSMAVHATAIAKAVLRKCGDQSPDFKRFPIFLATLCQRYLIKTLLPTKSIIPSPSSPTVHVDHVPSIRLCVTYNL